MPMKESELKDKLVEIFRSLSLNLDEEEIEVYLDSRDHDPFDSSWSHAYSEIELRKLAVDKKFLEILNKKNEQLRKDIFKITIKGTGSADLAAYVSDDFGMILDALYLNLNKSNAYHLLTFYQRGQLPQGTLNSLEKPDL